MKTAIFSVCYKQALLGSMSIFDVDEGPSFRGLLETYVCVKKEDYVCAKKEKCVRKKGDLSV